MRKLLTETESQYRNFEHGSWERAARYYADSFGSVTAPFARHLLEAVDCTSGTQVLEVASGTGYISHLASKLGAQAQAVDFSAAMVAEASKRYQTIAFAEADAEDLPFSDQSFDAVVIGFGVHHFPSARGAVSEAHRVLRIGGKFAFTVWSSTDNRFQQVLMDAISESGLRGSSLPTPPNGDIKDPESCINLLKEGGFSVESTAVRKLEIPIEVSSAERLFEITAQSTARGAALIRSQPQGAVPAIIASLRQAMRPYSRGDGQGYEVPAVAILAVAIRRQAKE